MAYISTKFVRPLVRPATRCQNESSISWRRRTHTGSRLLYWTRKSCLLGRLRSSQISATEAPAKTAQVTSI